MSLTEETIYKAMFLVLFLPGVFIRSLYAYKARAHIKKRTLKERFKILIEAEGHLGALLLLGQAAILFAGFIIYLFYTSKYPWLQLPIPSIARYIGFLIGIPGFLLLAWTHYILDKYWSVTIEFREEHKLVEDGPYKWIRHPMYTAHIIYFLSWLLTTANTLFLANYLLTLTIIAKRIPKEEKALIQEFGQKYKTYMQRTGRLIPKITKRKQTIRRKHINQNYNEP